MNNSQEHEVSEDAPAEPMSLQEAERVADGLSDPSLPTAKAVAPEEVLKAENLSLRVMNLSYQEGELTRDLARTRELRLEKAHELIQYRKMLGEKYNIDFDVYEIEQHTGEIVARGTKRG